MYRINNPTDNVGPKAGANPITIPVVPMAAPRFQAKLKA